MSIYKELVEKALPIARAKKIKRICIGIHYTFVEVERGGTGLAYTFFKENRDCCELGEEIGFWKRPADIVIKGYLSAHSIEVCAGLATINAIFSSKKEFLKNGFTGDIFKELKLDSKDEVLMIGYFDSVFKRLEGRVKKIWVVDKFFGERNFDISDIIYKIKLAIVSSSTLVNKTLESLLEELVDVPEVLLMGPSTPLNPEIFRFTPVTWLCGSLAKDSELLFRKVCEGKGAKAFFKSRVLEKINIRVKK